MCRYSTLRKYKPASGTALVAQVAIATTALCFSQTGWPSRTFSNSMMRSRMRPFAISSRGDLPPSAGRGDESYSSSFGATTYSPPRPNAVLALVSAAEISESARPLLPVRRYHISGDTSGDTSLRNLMPWFAIACKAQFFIINTGIIWLREYATVCIFLQFRRNRTYCPRSTLRSRVS
jgi:hypothetical protein